MRSGGLGLWWRHFVMSSVRLLRVLFLFVIISNFSSRHRLQIPLLLLYVFDSLTISHLISWFMFFFLSSHMYFESTVSVSYFWCLNDFEWFLNLFLKVPPVLPIYMLVCELCFTMALYTSADFRHSPRRGQSVFTLQLQFFSGSLFGVSVFLGCCHCGIL